MSKNIDDRVVSMGFDNREFKKGAADTTKTLSHLEASISNAGTSSGLGSLSTAAIGVGSKFSALGTIATGALLSIGAKAVQLGENLIKSIAIDPITQGYSEYELKINSIRTMLASGKDKNGMAVDLAEVNKQLEALNKYSDQTIYSFSDMTSNIGKFTNAGVDLETSVNAIKGIANAAALSGASSNEASRAMYNFAQALSSGSVKLIDWKSIDLANMGTVEFKQQLINAAVAAGTLEKSTDGMYKVTTEAVGTTIELTSATKGWNESLTHQWLTSEVLIDTLGDYADSTTDIGKRATEAATKVRTWSALMETTKESVGSGWSTTFEIIFGDFDEATDLYTGLSSVIKGMVEATSDGRNKILSDWDKFGGRIALLETIKTVWQDIVLVATEVKRAFSSVFPPITGKRLAELTENLIDFVKSIKFSRSFLVDLWVLFRGIFSLISLGWSGLKFIFDVIVIAFKEILTFLPEGNKFMDFAKKIAMFFIDLKNSTDKSDYFAKQLEVVRVAIKTFADKIRLYINTLTAGGVEGLPKILQNIIGMFSSFKLPEFSKSGEGGESGLSLFMKKITDTFEKAKPIFTSAGTFISETFGKIKKVIGEAWGTASFTFGMEAITEVISDLFKMLLTGAFWLTLKKLVDSFTGIADSASGMLKGVTGILDGVKDSLKAYQTQLKSKALLQIAIAIGLLTVSLIALTLINPQKLTAATIAITVLFANLAASFVLLEKQTGMNLNLLAVQLIGLSTAILLMTASLVIIANIEPEKLKQGLKGLGIVMTEVAAFALAITKINAKNFLAASAGINIFAIGILALIGDVVLLGTVDPAVIKAGLTAMAIVLAEIAAFAIIVSGAVSNADLISSGSTLLFMAYALNDMSKTIQTVGTMDQNALIQGLVGVASTLGIMVVAMKVMATPGVLLGAAAMLVMAASIAVFTPALVTLGMMPLANLGIALLALVGVFTIFGIAGVVLGPLTPVLISLAGAIALLGLSMFAVGAGLALAGLGMLLFATGLATLTAIGSAGVTVIVAMISGLAMLIPLVMTKVGEGMIELAKVIITGAPIIAEAIAAVVTQLIYLIGIELPKFIAVIITFILALQTQVLANMPKFIEAGMKITLAFLKGVEENIGPITEAFLGIITNFLTALAEKLPAYIKAGSDVIVAYMEGLREALPKLIDAGFKMIVDFINGLAEAIRVNTPILIEAITNLSNAVVDSLLLAFGISDGASLVGSNVAAWILRGMVVGFISMGFTVVEALLKVGTDMLNKFKEFFGVESPSTVMFEFAKNLIQGIINGLVSMYLTIETEIGSLLSKMWAPFEDISSDYLEVGINIANGIIDGIKSRIDAVVTTVENLANDALMGIQGFLKMNSPSKKFFEVGQNMGLGTVEGIASYSNKVADEAKHLGVAALSGMSSTMGQLTTSLSENIDSAPSITPVLDLSNIRTGAGTLASLLNQGQTYGLALASSERTNNALTNQNGSLISEGVTSNQSVVENRFDIRELVVRTEADIKAIALELKRLQETAVRGKGLRLVHS